MATPHTSKAIPELDHLTPIQRVHVLLPLPLGTTYDYAVAPGESVEIGDFVTVPLGKRMVQGVVWGEGPADPNDAVADHRLRPIAQRLDVPAMAEVTRRFVTWLADYTCSTPGAALRLTMSVPTALEPPRPRLAFALEGPLPQRMTSARARVIDVLSEGPPMSAKIIAEMAGVSGSVIHGLAKAGTLREVQLSAELPVQEPDFERPGVSLNADQTSAVAALTKKIEDDCYSVTLLDGVTGAGKTEVYLESIAKVLSQGRQVLVLVPEIGLTAQWLQRFRKRFGAEPLSWHSDLGTTRRRLTWRAVAQGRARVIVGARSSLFLPYTDLGLIIVDEEHDSAFKQEDGLIYHGRDMAVLRASLGEIPIILVSATPSLESLVNLDTGRYSALHLPERIGTAKLPKMEAIDMRDNTPDGAQWLSPTLVTAIKETLQRSEQVLLFLNRRGYAPLTLCRTCGHRLECPHCTAWLVEHRFHARLQCHHCGFNLNRPNQCPNCEAADSLIACGPGVERLSEEVDRLFPDIKRMLIASDTIRGPTAAAEAIRIIADGEISLIIGTQIVAKGHHFPLLTLVGVIDADLGLQGGDLRAAERTYQVLHQVAGRSGRAQRPGRALLQTYMPEHPVMEALISGDRDSFMAREQEARRAHGLPPFGRLVALIVSGQDEAQVSAVARKLGRAAPRRQNVEILGPAPAPLRLLRGRFRYRFLLKCSRNTNASALARGWVGQVKAPSQVRITIDVDPYNFL